MDFEVSYSLDNAEQFWEELDEITSTACPDQSSIDGALKSFLRFAVNFKDDYLTTEEDFAKCCFLLLGSTLFQRHKGYVRRRLVGRLLREPLDSQKLYFIVCILLYDGRQNHKSLELLCKEGAFPRLKELILRRDDNEVIFQRMLLELLYEMSRMQRLPLEDLETIDDQFICYLFERVEDLSEDPSDPYNYANIKVLLVLNEQYMVMAHAPNQPISTNGTSNGEKHSPQQEALTNRVIKVLCMHGHAYKTFGENIILLLNRESETSLQLLILKVLYLLFTTKATYEYFYTNDLRVLVDVIIRNLLDLPDDAEALRHTYLRVLYPLLAHTQLSKPPYYKKAEITKLLQIHSNARSAHFDAVDDTTLRLAGRCSKVHWLAEEDCSSGLKETAKKFLGMTLAQGAESNMSVFKVAELKEKPGVRTPSRTLRQSNGVATHIEGVPGPDGTPEVVLSEA